MTRIMRFGSLIPCLALVLGLSACGSNQDDLSGARLLQSTATGFVAARRAAVKQPQPAFTQAMFSQVDTSVQLITVDGPDLWALTFPIARNGDVQTWQSVDKKTVSFRRGILVATRGIGFDLMSADVPAPGMLARGSGGHTRTHVTLDGEDRPVRASFNCTATVVGPQTLTIAERNYATRHVREDCEGATGRFSNDYWFENGLNLRQSRQWSNEVLQYVGTKLLK